MHVTVLCNSILIHLPTYLLYLQYVPPNLHKQIARSTCCLLPHDRQVSSPRTVSILIRGVVGCWLVLDQQNLAEQKQQQLVTQGPIIYLLDRCSIPCCLKRDVDCLSTEYTFVPRVSFHYPACSLVLVKGSEPPAQHASHL